MAKSQKFTEKTLEAITNRMSEKFGSTVTKQEVSYAVENPPQNPEFPLAIVLLNAIFDIVSIALSLLAAVDGGATYLVFKAIIWSINITWFFGKISALDRAFQKAILRRLMIWIVVWIFSDMIPLNDLITANTFLILSVHYQNNKVVKIFWESMRIFYAKAPQEIKSLIDIENVKITRRARNPNMN